MNSGINLSQDEKQLIALITEAVVALLAIYNGFVAPLYQLPNITIATDNVNAIVCFLVVVAVTVWNAWKNRNFTYAAKLGQMVVDSVKSGVLAPEAVEEMLDEAQEDYNSTMQVEQDKLNAEIEAEVEQFMEDTGNKE